MCNNDKLTFREPSLRWDEGIPLGNGLTGVMIWGDGNPLKISLDRNDLWDLRPVDFYGDTDYKYDVMRDWVADNRMDDLHRVYEDVYEQSGPTKIPAGRLEVRFDKNANFKKMHLDTSSAVAEVEFNGFVVKAFVHATQPITVVQFTGVVPEFELLAPDYEGLSSGQEHQTVIYDGQDLDILGYKNAEYFANDNARGIVQKCWADFEHAFAIKWIETKGHVTAVLASATSNESCDPLALALGRCERALEKGYQTLYQQHLQWWKTYWGKSTVKIPNAKLQKQWMLDMYKFGAACRENILPASLQGPWTSDNGKLPPWRGDYHHDLNTQLCYWPAYSGNHLEQESGFIEWLWKTRDKAIEWTERFFNKPGLAFPMTVDAEGKPIGGWHQYSCSATTSSWLAQHFYLHWQYSKDEQFLKTRAYPFISDVAVFLEAITELDDTGQRFLPLSSSPEYYDNTRKAWFDSNTNYDISLMRFVFEKAAEMAGILGKKDDEIKWVKCLSEMPQIAVSQQEGILLANNHPLGTSHRHHSHLISVYPLGLVSFSKADQQCKIIQTSLDQLRKKGTNWWVGYSFAWHACLAARAMRGDLAEKSLEVFSENFCLKNSMHCNGDYLKQGHSNWTYRPFTLEGNCAAAAAIHEMLLQSDNGLVRLFPAIPESWKDVEFKTLRTEGAFLVSAKMKNGCIKYIKIYSEKGGRIKLLNPFATVKLSTEGAIDNIDVSREYITVDIPANNSVTITSCVFTEESIVRSKNKTILTIDPVKPHRRSPSRRS